MLEPIDRLVAFALYQFSLLLGLLLLPIALLARYGGVTLPIDRLLERSRRAYEATHK